MFMFLVLTIASRTAPRLTQNPKDYGGLVRLLEQSTEYFCPERPEGRRIEATCCWSQTFKSAGEQSTWQQLQEMPDVGG